MSEEFSQTLTSFVLELVQIKSVNGQDLAGETAVANRIHKEATKLGLESQLLGVDPHRQNVVVTANIDITVNETSPLASQVEPIGLMLFVGHMDTVAIGDKWTTSPHGQIYGDKIYGRGTSDNKAGIVCALYALSELQNSDALDLRTSTEAPSVQKRAKIVLAGVVDEESGAQSTLGLNYLLAHHFDLIEGYGAIYTYLNQTVTIGHRGLQRYIVEVNGESVHSGSERWNSGTEGANAVAALSEIVLALEREQWPEDRNENFGDLTLKVTPGTVFNGGSFESIVPSKAQMIIDCRTMPSTNVLQLENRIKQIVQQVIDRRNEVINATIDNQNSSAKKNKLQATVTNKNNLPAVVIPQGREHPLARACVSALTKIGHKTEDIKIQACGPANESYMLMTKGIPTICGFGPSGGNPHGADEFVEISSLAETVQIYQQVVVDYIKYIQCK